MERNQEVESLSPKASPEALADRIRPRRPHWRSQYPHTPTYHVFEMFKAYQDATALAIDVKSPWYNRDASTMPAVTASAVRDKDGRLHISLVNVDPNHAITITAKFSGITPASVTGRVLTAPAINSHNTFEQPTVVKPAAFTGAAIESGTLKAVLPPKSVVMLDPQHASRSPRSPSLRVVAAS